jgi:hypothetical protein
MYENSQAALNAYAKRIAELAEEVEVEDPIDWGMVSLDEKSTYSYVANHVVSKFDKYNMAEREVMLATITKLVVENFVLHLKLQQGK